MTSTYSQGNPLILIDRKIKKTLRNLKRIVNDREQGEHKALMQATIQIIDKEQAIKDKLARQA